MENIGFRTTLFSSRYTVANFSISFPSQSRHRQSHSSSHQINIYLFPPPEVIDMDRNPILPTSRNATAWGSNTSVLRPDETIAFAFDIDGVLIRNNISLPGARETLSMLQRYKVPFIFLTNGGGLTRNRSCSSHRPPSKPSLLWSPVCTILFAISCRMPQSSSWVGGSWELWGRKCVWFQGYFVQLWHLSWGA